MNVAVLLLAIALVIVMAVLAALGASKLARMDGASYPTALTRAAVTFAAVITLACTAASALPALLRCPHTTVDLLVGQSRSAQRL
ncbi:hypothetical protein ACFWAZ_28210 [Streptomyces collinus]|uniref:hypothetical protein n=1 Tax=Streptomyces collinus TaxID=42684 RepID=UPI0036533BCB